MSGDDLAVLVRLVHRAASDYDQAAAHTTNTRRRATWQLRHQSKENSMTTTDDPRSPAERRLDGLNPWHFTRAAEHVMTQLQARDSGLVSLQPGDDTVYLIAVMRFGEGAKARYWVAHSLGGALYEWGGAAPVHPSYAFEKWTSAASGSREWTAHVIARFLTVLSGMIHERDDA